MIKTSYINPFSADAKEIVSKLGQVDNLDKIDKSLLNIVNHTPNQNLGNEEFTPKTIKDLALARLKWFLFRKTKEFDEKNYEYLFNPEIHEYDIVSFYLLCQAVAIGYGPDSHETQVLMDAEIALISQRLERLKSEPNDFQANLLRKALNQYVDTNHVYWTDIKHLLDFGLIELDQLIISKGRLIIEFEDFFIEFGDLIQNRNPKTMYEVMGGINLKSNLLLSFVKSYTKDYVNTVHEMSERMVEPNPIITELASNIKKIESKARELKYSDGGSGAQVDDAPVSFEMESFPPCVRKCIQGIKSGGRNDAIVLFLTPFVSYSRLCPGIFSMQETSKKISDVDPSLEITNNEVIPLIYDAANACSPPLFKDQPQEKININSKLGFGMHSELNLKYEGETQWYTPMSCDKIKLYMPNLCTPNVDCKKIGNPLTFYNRKRRIMQRKNKQQTQVNKDGN